MALEATLLEWKNVLVVLEEVAVVLEGGYFMFWLQSYLTDIAQFAFCASFRHV